MNVKRTEGEGFYSYLYLRKDLTPYYAGKGTGKRAFLRHSCVHPPKDKLRIVIFPMESEALAFESEKALIGLFGRKDNGTGILRNHTDGGDGFSGGRHSEEFRRRISERHRGNKYNSGRPSWSKGKQFSEEHRRNLSVARKGRSYYRGFRPSVETRQKMSEAAKRRWQSPAMQSERVRLSESLRNKPLRIGIGHSQETRDKISRALIGNKNHKGRGKCEE